MKSIAFKNFRRFKELEPIEFAPITMLVGANNSGKSTVVKGILQMEAFLATSPTYKERDDEETGDGFRGRELAAKQKFFFNQNYYAHVCTAARALNKDADNNMITLHGSWNSYECEAQIYVENPKDQDAVYGIIEKIAFVFYEQNITADFNLKDRKCHIQFLPLNNDVLLRQEKNQSDIINRYNEMLGEGESCEIDISEITVNRYSRSDTLCGLLVDYLEDTINMTIMPKDMEEMGCYNTHPLEISSRTFEALNFLISGRNGKNNDRPIGLRGIHLRWPRRFESRSKIEYIYAHSVTQTSSYNVRDTNDYVVKTIHEFANTKRPRNSAGNQFIKKWMKAFGIGANYHITPFGGEAYMVEIEDETQNRTQLSDKGMGSIQLMVLLFRLATIIDGGVRFGATIILEEPEQNLHPQIQSKLADLFLDILINSNIWMIIETHSEYLIRRTQYLVATKGWVEGLKNSLKFQLKDDDNCADFSWNPFKVYYFPENGQPYDMEYQENGKFAQRFGPGFFDEASNLELAIIRNNKK